MQHSNIVKKFLMNIDYVPTRKRERRSLCVVYVGDGVKDIIGNKIISALEVFTKENWNQITNHNTRWNILT